VTNDIYNYSEEFIDIGLGMKPELTGKGYGSSFFSFVLYYITHSFEGISLRLTVASFNQRAIHLYSKFGFTKEFEFIKGTNSFTTMIK
jgi:ribosomal-protein-alanine N-acetyltransferase